MQQAGKALSTLNRGLSGTVRNTLSSRAIDDLFGRINAILGDKFFESFKGSDPEVFRAEWGATLADIKPIELERGLAQMARHKFSTLTLGEFMLWCRPALDPEWAFHEAYRCLQQRDRGMVGDWSHPAVWRAASTLALEVRQQDYAKVRTRWRFELERELAQGWSDIPQPPLRIENKVVTTNDSPVALAQRAKIKELLKSLKEPKEVGDGQGA